MKKLLWLVLLFSLSPTVWSADTASVVVTVQAPSREAAIAKALAEAIRQIKGVRIDASQIQTRMASMLHHQQNTYDSGTMEDRQKERTDQVLGNAQVGKIGMQSQGLVSSYRIVSARKLASGLEELTVEVHVADYKQPVTNANRRKLAILPPRISPEAEIQLPVSIRRAELSRMLSQHLVSEFVQSRRFRVMDRDYMKEYVQEKRLLSSGDAPVSELAKLGQVLGVDYMITGTLKGLYIKPYTERVAVVNEVRKGCKAGANLDYRIIVMATRQVKWSDTVNLKLSPSLCKHLMESEQPKGSVDVLLMQLAREVAEQALNNIYPIRIIEDTGKTALLNEGGKRVHVGEIFKVYQLGKRLVDPYTKESLGREEIFAGKIRAVTVRPKFTEAVWLERKVPAPIKVAIVRPDEEGQTHKAKKPAMKVYQPHW